MIVNLVPASLRKEGPAFDLPIALGILAASGTIPAERLESVAVVGELSLDGGLRGVRGALSISEATRGQGLGDLLLPLSNAAEAASISGVDVYGVERLSEAVEVLASEDVAPTGRESGPRPEENGSGTEMEILEDFADVAGQGYAKRALEVTAAGGHNVLMCVADSTYHLPSRLPSRSTVNLTPRSLYRRRRFSGESSISGGSSCS